MQAKDEQKKARTRKKAKDANPKIAIRREVSSFAAAEFLFKFGCTEVTLSYYLIQLTYNQIFETSKMATRNAKRMDNPSLEFEHPVEEIRCSKNDDASVHDSSNKSGVSSMDDDSSSSGESISNNEVVGIDNYEVEKILLKRIRGHKLEYYVKWKGYSDNDNTWVVSHDLLDYKELIVEFEYRDDIIKKQHRSSTLAPMSAIMGGRKTKIYAECQQIDTGLKPLFSVPSALSSKHKGAAKRGSSVSGNQSKKCKVMVDEDGEKFPDTDPLPTGFFKIDKILAKMAYEGRELYLVKWTGYGPADTTWEPFDHIKETNAFKKFQAAYGLSECLEWT